MVDFGEKQRLLKAAQVTRDSCKVTRESCKVTRDSCKVTQDSCKVNRDSCKVTRLRRWCARRAWQRGRTSSRASASPASFSTRRPRYCGQFTHVSRGSATFGLHFRRLLKSNPSQVTESSSIVPLCRSCDQLVLVGDQCQLPPTVASRAALAVGAVPPRPSPSLSLYIYIYIYI